MVYSFQMRFKYSDGRRITHIGFWRIGAANIMDAVTKIGKHAIRMAAIDPVYAEMLGKYFIEGEDRYLTYIKESETIKKMDAFNKEVAVLFKLKGAV